MVILAPIEGPLHILPQGCRVNEVQQVEATDDVIVLPEPVVTAASRSLSSARPLLWAVCSVLLPPTKNVGIVAAPLLGRYALAA